MESDIKIPNQIYYYYYIDRISLNHIYLGDSEKIFDIYIKDNMACKIFCCLAFSATLVVMYFFVKTFFTAFDLFPSAISDFKNIEESKLNLFKGIGKFLLGVLCLGPCIGWTIMFYFIIIIINPYAWAIFLGVSAAAILIMTVISTICLCRSNPVFLYAYEDEGEHKFAEKTIDKYDLTPLRGDRISFREKIFIRKEEMIRLPENEPEI